MALPIAHTVDGQALKRYRALANARPSSLKPSSRHRSSKGARRSGPIAQRVTVNWWSLLKMASQNGWVARVGRATCSGPPLASTGRPTCRGSGWGLRRAACPPPTANALAKCKPAHGWADLSETTIYPRLKCAPAAKKSSEKSGEVIRT
jgi:hypothetical protein